MFPGTKKTERGYMRILPRNENRNEGTFAKTTLLRNRPFVSSRYLSLYFVPLLPLGIDVQTQDFPSWTMQARALGAPMLVNS